MLGFIKYPKVTVEKQSADSEGVRWELFSDLISLIWGDLKMTHVWDSLSLRSVLMLL